jgi:hypothetical protein
VSFETAVITPRGQYVLAGLKDVYKDFNLSGEHLIERLKSFRARGVRPRFFPCSHGRVQ